MRAGFAASNEVPEFVFAHCGTAGAATQRFDEAGVCLIGGDGVHALHALQCGIGNLEHGLVVVVRDALDEIQLLRTAAERGEIGIRQAHLAQARLTGTEEGGGIIAHLRGDAGLLRDLLDHRHTDTLAKANGG